VPGVPGQATENGGRDFGTCCLTSGLLGLRPSERSVMEHLGAVRDRQACPRMDFLAPMGGADCDWVAEHSADSWRLDGDLPQLPRLALSKYSGQTHHL
jgi:hypothetical protein